MISRREVMTASVFGSMAVARPADAAEVQGQADTQAIKELTKSLEDKFDELRASLDQGLRGNSMLFGNLGSVKSKIENYTKTSGRFPEYCDVGLSVFYDVYDWHIRHQQPISISRVTEQRVAIQFMFTQLVVRPENDLNYIGAPYPA
jgi:hypothetical protein